jgi:hypothetical protein
MIRIDRDSAVERWTPRLARWCVRLRTARLDGVVQTLLEAVEPLGPVGAQLLWVAEPTLGLVVSREDIASLACLLDDPGGIEWLREQLTGPDEVAAGDGASAPAADPGP